MSDALRLGPDDDQLSQASDLPVKAVRSLLAKYPGSRPKRDSAR